MISLLHAKHAGEGYSGNGEAVQGDVLGLLQLWQGLHWRDSEETRNQNEGALACLSEGGTGKVGACTACTGEPPPDQVGGDHSG